MEAIAEASVDASAFEALLAQCRPPQPGGSVADVLNSSLLCKKKKRDTAEGQNVVEGTNPPITISTEPPTLLTPTAWSGRAPSSPRGPPATKEDNHRGREQERVSGEEHGATRGWSLLHEAVQLNRVDLVSVLIKKGANVNAADERGFTPLHFAALHNRKEALTLLISSGADVSAKSESGMTAHHLAAAHNHSFCLKELKKRKEGVLDVTCNAGWTPLHYAAYHGSINVSSFLLANGAAVNSLDAVCSSALHKAVARGHAGFVRLLLKYGADANIFNDAGETPLHIACLLDEAEIFDLLIAHQGINVHALTKDQRTCVHYAASKGKVAYIQKLLKKGNKQLLKRATAESGMNALHVAVESMLDVREEEPYTPAPATAERINGLHSALQSILARHQKWMPSLTKEADKRPHSPRLGHKAKKDSKEKVKGDLKKQGGSKDMSKGKGSPRRKILKSPRNRPSAEDAEEDEARTRKRQEDDRQLSTMQQCEAERINRMNEEKLQCVSFLLREGLDPYERDSMGQTILHHAAKHGVKDVFQHLVDSHPGGITDEDINAKDEDGNSCLHLAIKLGRRGLVKYLLTSFKEVININEKNGQGLTPFLLAVRAGCSETLQNLLDHDVSKGGKEHILDAKDEQGKGFIHIAAETDKELECLAFLLEAVDKERIKTKLSERDNHNDTPFTVAAKHGNISSMLLLLSKKKETDPSSMEEFLNNKGQDGRAAIHNVVDCTVESKQQGYEQCFWILLEEGADVNSVDNALRSPLHIAARRGHLEFVQGLVERGPDINGADHKGKRPLHMATISGNPDCVDFLLSKNASPNSPSTHGFLPLHLAALGGYTKCVEILLRNDPEQQLNSKDANGLTSLHYAATNGHAECVRLLLARGGTSRRALVEDSSGNCALHKAIHHAECVGLLLQHKANVNAPNSEGLTPLHLCCLAPHSISRNQRNATSKETEKSPRNEADKSVFEQLLDAGADCAIRTAQGDSVIHLLARSGKIIEMRMILDRRCINVDGSESRNKKDGGTALHALVDGISAVELRRRTMLDLQRYLRAEEMKAKRKAFRLQRGNDYDDDDDEEAANVKQRSETLDLGADLAVEEGESVEPAFYYAFGVRPDATSTKAMIELLVQHRIELDAQDNVRGETALLKAIRLSNKHNAGLIYTFVEALLEKGADVNGADFEDRTPLHLASAKGDSEAVLLLIKKGRPLVNAYDQWGNTPLNCALSGRHEDTASLLLENSARVDIRDEHGRGPLHFAALYGWEAFGRQLLSLGSSDIDSRCGVTGATPLILAAQGGHRAFMSLLLSKNANVELCTLDKKRTALHEACYHGHPQAVTALLSAHAKSSADRWGQTPLHLAAARGHASCIDILLARGASANPKTNKGNTPLHLAAIYGKTSSVKQLLSGGAQISATDAKGNTALHLAVRRAHCEVTAVLIDEIKKKAIAVDAQYGEDGYGPLHAMIAERLYGGDGSAAYRKATEEILGYLLGRGGVSLHSLDKKGRNILHILAGTHTGIVDKEKNESEENEETIELASSKNANDVLRRQESRMNLVHILIAKGICRGGGVNVREKENGNSPLHECVAKGDNELLALLCKNGGDVLLRNTQGETPVHVACRTGNLEAVKLLLMAKEGKETLHLLNSQSHSPLVSALLNGHDDIVQYLFSPAESGLTLDVDAKNAQGRAAIHYAVEGGKPEVLQLLLRHRADINAKEITTGCTPLHIACGAGFSDMVKFLLDNHADIEAQDKSARTPAKVAHDFKRKDIVELLVQRGAKPPQGTDLHTSAELLWKGLRPNDPMQLASEVKDTSKEDDRVRAMAKRGTFGPLHLHKP